LPPPKRFSVSLPGFPISSSLLLYNASMQAHILAPRLRAFLGVLASDFGYSVFRSGADGRWPRPPNRITTCCSKTTPGAVFALIPEAERAGLRPLRSQTSCVAGRLEDCEMVLWSEGQSRSPNFGFKPGTSIPLQRARHAASAMTGPQNAAAPSSSSWHPR